MTSHLAELHGHILLNGAPKLLAINETFLDKSTKDVVLAGYTVVSRSDRVDGSGGGILLFAANKVHDCITFLEHSDSHERSWHAIHADASPFLLCVWYRPPACGEFRSIQTFESEWIKLRDAFVGTLLVGDLNLHHTHWLKFSHSLYVEGSRRV